ncbi:hypothetical protein B566_EDAN006189 [Ephemera danica]|nr:hypothetical protein B566_EDAN006189 [Ephemera danica]
MVACELRDTARQRLQNRTYRPHRLCQMRGVTLILVSALLASFVACHPNQHHELRKRQATPRLEMVQIGKYQYYFSNIQNKLNWENARQFCKTNGLELATVNSKEENTQINAHAQKLYDRSGNDLTQEGNWKWDGTQEVISYNNFDSDQPGGGLAENCLLMHRSDGHWNDFDCNREFVFICKNLKAGETSEQVNAVQLELVQLGNHQWYFSNRENLANWTTAQKFCVAHGLEFANVESEAENKLVNAHAQKLYDRKLWGAWLGGSDLAQEANWIWDGTKEPFSYNNFDSDQPGGGLGENCLLMHRSDGHWNDFDCGREFVFFCKKRNAAAPKPKLELVQLGKHMFYFSNRDTKLPWTAARDFCRANNLEFARIEGARENSLVVSYARKLYERRLWGIWLGGSDLEQESNWVWDANQKPFNYNNFDNDQPGGGLGENCLLLHRSDGAWNDFDCEREFNFICKQTMPDSLILTTSLPLITLGEHQYYFSTKDHRVTWNEARQFCQDNGLELTSVENMQENRLIQSHFQNIHRSYSPWIGGTDAESEGNWVWDATLQPTKFTYWWTYQPDGKSNENCLFMYADDGMWGDRSCTYTKPFVCRKYE